jgi:phage baseplate assembly protein W
MSDDRSFLGRGWRFPVAINLTGGIASSALEENIRESIFIVLGTAPGERVMRPDFGCRIHDLMFEPNNYATSARAEYYCEEALYKYEPRISRKLAVKAGPNAARAQPPRHPDHLRDHRPDPPQEPGLPLLPAEARRGEAMIRSPVLARRPPTASALVHDPKPQARRPEVPRTSSMRRSASSRGTRPSGPITTRPIPGITLLELAAWMTDLLVHPPEPGPREELRRVPEPARHQAARAARGQGAPAVQADRGHGGAAGAGGDPGVDPAGRRRLDGHLRDRARGRDHRGRARSLLLVRSTNTYADNSRYANPEALPEGSFEVFAGAQRIDRYLYLIGPAVRGRRRVGGAAGLRRMPRARRPRSGAHARVVSTGTASGGRR